MPRRRKIQLHTIAFAVITVAACAAIVQLGPEDPTVRGAAMVGVAALFATADMFVGFLARQRQRRRAVAVTSAADRDEKVLEILGIETDDGDLRAACSRIARRIHADKIRVIGFVPSHDRVAVPPLIIQLGLSLTELTGATVAVVDANVRYPGLGALNRGKSTDSDDSVFSTRWIKGSLALLSPPRVERAGEVVPQLARVLLDGSDLFAHVLVDLTGFELLGEHGSAAACMDAVALVGRAHTSREDELLELARLMPEGRFLGVLLVG
ncbi:MAG: hypothetical protein KF773_07160 [Deltaproteobacteria bacterium]|nr:hypothetical protein [Deltaproteobacteria bacterium]MCW5806200.1 hypothetical protein [Deltaproteobacteria bacterium]